MLADPFGNASMCIFGFESKCIIFTIKNRQNQLAYTLLISKLS